MGFVRFNLECHLHLALIIEMHLSHLTRNNAGNADILSVVQSIDVTGFDIDVDKLGSPALRFGKPRALA